MENTLTVLPKAKQFTDTIVGNGWKHTDKNGREYINITINGNLDKKIVLAAGSALTLKSHTKRTGTNPKTGKEFKDADYFLTVELA